MQAGANRLKLQRQQAEFDSEYEIIRRAVPPCPTGKRSSDFMSIFSPRIRDEDYNNNRNYKSYLVRSGEKDYSSYPVNHPAYQSPDQQSGHRRRSVPMDLSSASIASPEVSSPMSGNLNDLQSETGQDLLSWRPPQRRGEISISNSPSTLSRSAYGINDRFDSRRRYGVTGDYSSDEYSPNVELIIGNLGTGGHCKPPRRPANAAHSNNEATATSVYGPIKQAKGFQPISRDMPIRNAVTDPGRNRAFSRGSPYRGSRDNSPHTPDSGSH